jgi:hypothetical protein
MALQTADFAELASFLAKTQSGATSDRSNDAVDRIIRRLSRAARVAETAILGDLELEIAPLQRHGHTYWSAFEIHQLEPKPILQAARLYR